MPDDTPASRARVALASALWDAQHHHARARPRIRTEVDEEALLAAMAVQITAAVEEAMKPLRESAELLVLVQDAAEKLTPVPPPSGASWSIGYWKPDDLHGKRFVAVLKLDPEHFERARAALQEPRDE